MHAYLSVFLPHAPLILLLQPLPVLRVGPLRACPTAFMFSVVDCKQLFGMTHDHLQSPNLAESLVTLSGARLPSTRVFMLCLAWQQACDLDEFHCTGRVVVE